MTAVRRNRTAAGDSKPRAEAERGEEIELWRRAPPWGRDRALAMRP